MTRKTTPLQRELRTSVVAWKLLRTKLGTQDDPDFIAAQLDPRRTVIVVVSGTAADGDYGFDYAFTDAAGEDVTGTVVFDRAAGETNAQIAAGLEGEIDGDTDLAPAISDAADSGATVVIELSSLGEENLVLSNFVAPTGAVLRAEQIVTRTLATRRDPTLGPAGKVFIEFVPIDVNGVPLAPGTMTATIQAIDCIDRDTNEVPDAAAAIGGTDETTGQEAYIRGDLVMNGSQAFTVRLSDVANPPAGTVAIEVHIREAAT